MYKTTEQASNWYSNVHCLATPFIYAADVVCFYQESLCESRDVDRHQMETLLANGERLVQLPAKSQVVSNVAQLFHVPLVACNTFYLYLVFSSKDFMAGWQMPFMNS